MFCRIFTGRRYPRTRTNMKRKRGHKGGHKKGAKKNKSSTSNLALDQDLVNAEVNASPEKVDDSRTKCDMEIEQSSVGSEKAGSMSNSNNADVSNDKSTGKAGPGRVKVKLKSSRLLEPDPIASDAQTQSDTERSNLLAGVQMLQTPLLKEDNTFSDGQTSEMQNSALVKSPKKAGSIKFKSSRTSGFSSEVKQDKIVSKVYNPPTVLENDKMPGSSVPVKLRHRETKKPYSDPRYNEKELSSSLDVIKKVMKMDAAAPFNTPVNPDALGIPDYFDMIKTPMDFGTICNDLQSRQKYMNSEDVYRDVQYIWDNCYKYNNKGDYVVDLMKRVKKNFMKYWTAACLYSNDDIHKDNSDVAVQPGIEKHSKNKSKLKRRRYGIEHHKSDCLCAVCVVRRRRKEREGDLQKVDSVSPSDAIFLGGHQIKEHGSMEHPRSENVSSSLDRSQEMATNAEAESDNNIEITRDQMQHHSRQQDEEDQEAFDDEISAPHDNPPSGGINGESSRMSDLENGAPNSDDHQSQELEETEAGAHEEDQEDEVEEEEEGEEEDASAKLEDAFPHHHQDTEMHSNRELVGGSENMKQQQQKRQEETPLQGNHAILQICKTLFPLVNDSKSVWNGPRSLSQRRGNPSSVPLTTPTMPGGSLLHAAVEYLLRTNK